MEIVKEWYIINLEKDKARMADLKANFDEYGIPFQRFDAVYGKHMTQDEIRANTTFMCRMLWCNKSIVGSGMSHYRLWKKIAEQPAGFYMVCEDDVNLTPTTVEGFKTIKEFVEGREKEPIMISLNSCLAYHYNDHSKLIKPTRIICGIAAYLLTPETARRLRDYIDRAHISRYIDLQASFCSCGIQHFYTAYPVIKDSIYGGADTSNNMAGKALPLLQFVLTLVLPPQWSAVINFRLNLTVMCLFMTYCLAIGHLLLLFLLLLGLAFRQPVLLAYVAVEIVSYIIARLQ
jgi:GR25 family glycosyltransferase involved in LPS biosynthesis